MKMGAPEETVSYRNLYLSVFIINIVYYAAGESNVWTSPALPRLQDPSSRFALFQLNESWLVSCFAMGQVFGPVISGCLMDSLGRKPTTLFMVLFLLISCALLYLGSSALLLYCARVLAGFSFGMSVSVLPVFVAEISDPKIRGTLNSLPLLSRSLGYFTMYAVGPLLNYDNLVVLSTLAPALALLLVSLVPESPYHLLAKGKAERALETVRWLKRGASKDVVQAELDVIQKSVEDMKASRKGYRDFFTSRASQRAFFISCGLLFFLQMSGIPVILSITESLFILAKVSVSTKVCTLMFGGLMLAVGLLGPFVTRRFGYRNPLLISATGMFFSVTIFGGHFYLIHLKYDMSNLSFVPLASLVAYVSFYSLGFSNSAFSVVGELFAPNVKALGTSLVNCIGFACAFLSIQIFYAVWATFGIHFGIWTFSLTNAFAIPFTYFLVPDTSRLSLPEIQDMLASPWFVKKNKVVPVTEKFTMKEVC